VSNSKSILSKTRVWLTGAIVLVGIVAGGLATSADAAPTVLPLYGFFSGHEVSAGCPSPVGFCLVDKFRGTLNGTAEAVTASLYSTPDPTVGAADTNLVLHDTRGDVKCRAQSLFGATATSHGEFAFLCVITGGTRLYSGATGYLTAFGDIPSGTEVQATYGGKIFLATSKWFPF
jgi:hypothetical protein